MGLPLLYYVFSHKFNIALSYTILKLVLKKEYILALKYNKEHTKEHLNTHIKINTNNCFNANYSQMVIKPME